ncbi:hypothetical protein CHS0354_006054 [Potamilus streckersoni]|uniref:Uncharacterized protein n=1 Tax=Potamilus streckersoni TaxID=2493646 RepID=A0AAE0W1W2_9BIVA|nr:hypothetical protein CHS0354_006054 [Potamilus streckersoni]
MDVFGSELLGCDSEVIETINSLQCHKILNHFKIEKRLDRFHQRSHIALIQERMGVFFPVSDQSRSHWVVVISVLIKSNSPKDPIILDQAHVFKVWCPLGFSPIYILMC